jgi:hypothetical protein
VTDDSDYFQATSDVDTTSVAKITDNGIVMKDELQQDKLTPTIESEKDAEPQDVNEKTFACVGTQTIYG